MERFVKGDVVVMPFPFSDLSDSKKRPALVIADLGGEDVIVCQITSVRQDKYSISLSIKDFAGGSLNRDSFIRPNKLFTISKQLINYKAGTIIQDKLSEVLDKIVEILRS